MVKREGGQTRQEIAAMISGYESLRYDLTWFAKCARTDVSHSNECKRNHEITNETSELIHRASVFVKQQLGSFSTTYEGKLYNSKKIWKHVVENLMQKDTFVFI